MKAKISNSYVERRKSQISGNMLLKKMRYDVNQKYNKFEIGSDRVIKI